MTENEGSVSKNVINVFVFVHIVEMGAVAALDRQFKTIDFLTLLDLETMPSPARQKFLNA